MEWDRTNGIELKEKLSSHWIFLWWNDEWKEYGFHSMPSNWMKGKEAKYLTE